MPCLETSMRILVQGLASVQHLHAAFCAHPSLSLCFELLELLEPAFKLPPERFFFSTSK